MVSLWFHKLIPCPEQAQYLRWGVSLIELVPVWRRVGIPQAGSRSVGRSCTPPGTAPAWYARHDSGLSSAASLSFLLTDRIFDEKTVKSKRNGTGQRRAAVPHPSMALQGRYSLSQKKDILEPYFSELSLNHLIIWFQWLHSAHTGTQLGKAVRVKATVKTAMKTAIFHPTHESAALETPLWLHCWKTFQWTILAIMYEW